MTFDNYYLVQFYIQNNSVVPVWERKLQSFVSKLHPTAAPFLAPEKSSKYGYKKIRNATHWGLFQIIDDEPKLVVHEQFKKNSRFKKQMDNKMYIHFRMKNELFSFMISNYESYKHMCVSSNIVHPNP
jgi:hypothetical protein